MATETIGAVAASSKATLVTANATIGNFGSYTQLVASTARESKRITINLLGETSGAAFIGFIATGAGGAETDKIPFHFDSQQAGQPANHIELPYTIPSGTRVSVKIKSTDSSAQCLVSCQLSDDGDYGTSTAANIIGDSGGQGTVIDPGPAANTKGAWVQLSASTPADFDLLTLYLSGNDNGAQSPANILLDIGTGTGGAEVVLIADIPFAQNNVEFSSQFNQVMEAIASGTRVAVRMQSSITDATDRKVDVCLVGSTVTASGGSCDYPAEADVRSGTSYDSGGMTGSAVIPAASDVRSGTSVDAGSGTLDLPAVADVQSGVGYDNATKTGTFAPPAEADVRSGTGFGAASEFTGSAAIPAAANVRSGIAVDADVGSLAVPAAGHVRSGVFVDAGVGSAAIPAAADVRSGTAVDATTGSLDVPAGSDVRTGVAVDAGVGSADIPAAADVRSGTAVDAGVGSLAVPAAGKVVLGEPVDAGSGTHEVPPEAKVELAFGYGEAGTEFTGSLAGGGGGGTRVYCG